MAKKYIGAWDLFEELPDGKKRKLERTGIITKVEAKLLRAGPGKPPEQRVTISLASSSGKAWPKQFIANSTNCTTIEQMYGADIEGWVKQKITLYPDKTRDPRKKGNVLVDCVRVKNTMPKGDADEMVEQPIDEEMIAAQDEAFGTDEEDDASS